MIRHFRIERLLGEGGFAFTYLARDTMLGCNVAIKELFPHKYVTRQGRRVIPIVDRETWKDIFDRFSVEARHLAQFQHKNIVQVRDLIEAGGTAYIVMQYLEGRSFSEYLSALGRLPNEEEIRPVFRQILDGLDAVHHAGLLHRDVKPGNIYLTRDGTVVLLDFGTARPEKKPPNDKSLVFYSGGYTSYEQCLNMKLTHTADIYSVAATFVRAITGKEPPEAICRNDREIYKPLSIQYKGRYSAALLRGIDMGMGLKAAHRPQTIAQWRAILFGKPPTPPPAPGFSRATLVFALFVCLVVASTAAWIAVRMGSQKPQTVQAGSGKTATTTPEEGTLLASAPDTSAIPPPVSATLPPSAAEPQRPSQPQPVHAPTLVAKASPVLSSQPPAAEKTPPVEKPPAAAVVASPPPPPRTTVAASTGTQAPDLDQELNAFLKDELEQPLRQENYAALLVINDSGVDKDRRQMTREDFIQEDQADEERYTPGPGQFTHLGSKRLSYDKDTDTAVLSQIFSFDRTARGNNPRRFFGLVVRQMVIAKASTPERCVAQRIVTARASGYRCRLSAADHPVPPAGAGSAPAAISAAAIRAILQKDRENVETRAHVDDGEDMPFPPFSTAADRARITTVPDAQTVVIPGGDQAARQIISGTPVVDVFPDLAGPAPAIVIVVKS